MTKPRLTKILELLQMLIILSIVFLVPVYFAVIIKTSSVFELDKQVIFRILVLCLLVVSVLDYQGLKNKFLYLKQSKKILWLFCVLLLTYVLATVFSTNRELSFFGAYNYFQGLETFFYYFLFLILFLFNIQDKGRAELVIKSAVWASLAVSLYGLFQLTGFDPLKWQESADVTGRVFSSLGQPNFLASYLLLVMPFSVYFLLCAKKNSARFIYALIFGSNLLCLYHTLSRGAWLGLIFSLVSLLALVLYLRFKDSQKDNLNVRKVFFGLVVISLIMVSAIFIAPASRERLKEATDLKAGSLAVRIQMWQAGWEFLKSPRVIIGYGPDTQTELFYGAYQKGWAIYSDIGTIPERAHNLIFDIILTRGLIGLVVYTALVCYLYYLIIFNLKKRQETVLYLAVFFGLTAYLCSLLFSYAVTATEVYFFLYTGLIAVFNQKEREINKENLSKFNWKLKVIWFIVCLAVILGSGIFIKRNYHLYLADYYFQEFKKVWILDNDYAGAVGLYDLISRLDTGYDYYDIQIAGMLAQWDQSLTKPIDRQVSNILLQSYAGKLNRNTFGSSLAKARVLAVLSSRNSEYFNEAEEIYQNLIARSPEMASLKREFGYLYQRAGKIEEANFYFNEAINSLPDLNNPYLNERHRDKILEEKFLSESLILK